VRQLNAAGSPMPSARPGARRPWSVGAPAAGVRMGMRVARRGTGNVGGRPLHRDGDAQPARPWRRCAGA
jgi:hypothetical protein